ncbi:hypothetical protein [Pseudonocardia humida]|uniref:Small secreted protein n=1 Tax=Pseudonocardia humida TaxID=2800819 RepID=A0ABT1ACW6_9PSEU|nr:hypothetical protein [Pseudonocardia humida]MCO1660901.1 hypothetical protein [Pseudonocardia humida]
MTDTLRRRGRSATSPLVALAAAAGLALAGCATDAPVAPDAPEPVPAPGGEAVEGTAGPEAVAWTGSVCEALVPVAQTLRTPPEIDVTAPQAARQAYRDFLVEARTQADQAQQQLSTLGAPPVEEGEELAQEVQEQVTDLREDVTEALNRVEAADPNNPLAIGEAVVAGGNVLGAVGNNVQAVGALTDEPELRNAFEQAPACEELRDAGDSE